MTFSNLPLQTCPGGPLLLGGFGHGGPGVSRLHSRILNGSHAALKGFSLNLPHTQTHTFEIILGKCRGMHIPGDYCE